MIKITEKEFLRLKRLNDISAALRRVNRCINRASEKNELLENICSAFAKEEFCFGAWAAFLNSDKDIELSFGSVPGMARQESASILENNLMPRCFSLNLEIAEKLLIINGKESCSSCLALGPDTDRSVISMKIESRDTTAGILCICVEKTISDDPEILEQFSETAGESGYALSALCEKEKRIQTENKLKESRDLFQKMLSVVPDMISIHDRDMNIRYSNWRGFGAIPSEKRNIGAKCYNAYRDRDSVCPDCKARMVLETGEPFHEEIALPEGMWVDLRILPIKNEKGKTNLFVEWVKDISEQKRTEKALLENESRFRGIFENSISGIALHSIIKDENGQAVDYKILDVNPAFEKITGVQKEKAKRKRASELYGTDDTPFLKIYSEVTKTGSSKEFETRFEPMNKTFSISAFSLGNERFATIFEDITERKEIEQKIRQMEKMDAVGQLAGGIAHDFNNQLSGVMGYGSMLVEKLKEPTLRRYAENMLTGAKRSADLTEQLLAFSRKGQFQLVRVNVHKIIDEVIGILQHSIDKKIDVKRIFEAATPIVNGDPSQLQNALLNLALNARDALPEGGEIIFATNYTELDSDYCFRQPYEVDPGKYIRISVTDNGTGMDDETRKHIFEPFFTTKEPGRGTGMGLAAVYGTVKNHGGSVNVYSEPGHGTTFHLYIPAASGVET
ncbi:MAG: ATP-binding protein, partial [Fibrobacterota bacterium]